MVRKCTLIILLALVFTACASPASNQTPELNPLEKYCSQPWGGISPNPICDGSLDISPPTIDEAVQKMQQTRVMLLYEGYFSDPADINGIAADINYLVWALDYAGRLQNQQTGELPSVINLTQEDLTADQVNAFSLLAQKADEEGLSKCLVVGPNVRELAEVATTEACVVFGVTQRPDSGLINIPVDEPIPAAPLDKYKGMDGVTGISFLFNTGVELIPPDVEFDTVIMQNPRPDTVVRLCTKVVDQIKVDGFFIIVPDQEFVNDVRPFQSETWYERTVRALLTDCLTHGLFTLNAEETTPEALRLLTGYNSSRALFGDDFSDFASQDGTLMKIIIIKREQ